MSLLLSLKKKIVRGGVILTNLIKECESFKISVLRALRDYYLITTLWLHKRHLSQPDGAKNLTDSEYMMWQNYWQGLRDLPTAPLPLTLIESLDVLPTT